MSGVLPTDWFLEDNKTLMRPVYTSDNEVAGLVDGETYMEKLLNAIQGLQSAGYIHIASWRLTPSVRLLGDLPDSPSVEEVLTERAESGIHIRSLLWYVPGTIGDFGAGHGPENIQITQLLKDLGQEAILDDRLPGGTFASHHQKYIVLGDNAKHIAFIGGIDLALDRWDDISHDDPAGRQRELFDGWHDVQVRIEGPAVAQLWDCFRERWNDPRKSHGALFTVGNEPVTPIPAAERPAVAGNGTCHVQVLRTYPCECRSFSAGDATTYPFAPAGDRSYEAALKKAIGAAEHYIYIEDQYFWTCNLIDPLAQAVERGVSIILLLTNNYDVPGLVPFHNFLRDTCIKILRPDDEKVFAFTLTQEQEFGGDDIYIHAKTVIIDDRYAVIGSANINSRSMSTDTEIGVAIVDEALEEGRMKGQDYQACGFAREYRKALWKEHLGIEIDDPIKPDGTPNGWPTQAEEQFHHVQVQTVPPDEQLCTPSFLPFILMNPDTICP